MGKIKEFISENKILLIVGLVILIGCFVAYYFINKNNNLEYNPTLGEDVPYIKKEYKSNEYINIDVELIDLLNEYYAYFVKKKINSPKEAYKMLTEENKKKFGSAEKYEEYVKNPLITKQRMFYEAMEEVLPDVRLIIDDGSGDLNKTLYLDELQLKDITNNADTTLSDTPETNTSLEE